MKGRKYMNIQAMMKQAQKLQQEMMKTKEEIDAKIFPGKYSVVEVEINGKKELTKVAIDKNFRLEEGDFEMLEDMIVLAVNDAMKKVDAEIESKMGKYGSGLSGLM
jgi:DNA-binding YbaB/EbfC family protein